MGRDAVMSNPNKRRPQRAIPQGPQRAYEATNRPSRRRGEGVILREVAGSSPVAGMDAATSRSMTAGAGSRRNLRVRVRPFLIAAAAVAAALGTASAAFALWSVSDSVGVAAIRVGDVSFGASGQTGPTDGQHPQYSDDGDAVTLTLPGAEIIKVLGQTSPDPEPVIWRFDVTGFAQGVAGMSFDVSVPSQTRTDNGTTLVVADLTADPVDPDTVLAQSTIKIYPASITNDCSAVPTTPTGPAQNIYVFDGDGHVLQAADSYAGAPTTQQWCVAMDFNRKPDGGYANRAQATGTADDTSIHSAIDRWDAIVGFRPSLAPLGRYVNRADVAAIAQDGTISRANDVYYAIIFPDPSSEPDLTIKLKPTVTLPTP